MLYWAFVFLVVAILAAVIAGARKSPDFPARILELIARNTMLEHARAESVEMIEFVGVVLVFCGFDAAFVNGGSFACTETPLPALG